MKEDVVVLVTGAPRPNERLKRMVADPDKYFAEERQRARREVIEEQAAANHGHFWWRAWRRHAV